MCFEVKYRGVDGFSSRRNQQKIKQIEQNEVTSVSILSCDKQLF